MFGEEHAAMFGSLYHRIKADEEHVFAPVGKERVAKCKWDQGKQRTIEVYWDKDNPEDRPNKIAFNAYLPDEDRIVIYEGPGSLIRDLVRAKIEEGRVIRVQRTGSGKSTKFLIEKLDILGGEEWARICDMPQHDLSDMWKSGDAVDGAPAPSEDESDGIPF